MWAAYYQAEGHMRFTVALVKMKHRAEFELEKFLNRMPFPEAEIFWVWCEEIEEDECPTSLTEKISRLIA